MLSGFLPIVLCSIFLHMKGLHAKGSYSPTENAAPALPETTGLESSLYFSYCMCVTI